MAQSDELPESNLCGRRAYKYRLSFNELEQFSRVRRVEKVE